MLNKKHKVFLTILVTLIITAFISYKMTIYAPILIDSKERNIIEKTVDFFMFGFHLTKASVYSEYIKDNNKAAREFGKAGWYRKKYLEKKFKIDGNDLNSVLNFYKNINTTSILKDLYTFLMNEGNQEPNFFREAGEKFLIWNNWKKSAEAFSRVIDSNPNDIMSYYYLGLSYLGLKKLDKAKQCFEEVIILNKDFADAYYQLGLIEEKKKNLKKAQILYENTNKHTGIAGNFPAVPVQCWTSVQTNYCRPY